MLVSDLAGAIGSLLILIPSARDLLLRAKREKTRGDPKSPIAALRAALANDLEKERSALSGYDVGSFSLGALLLVLSFVIKLFGY